MATSKLQRITGNKLDNAFPGLRIRENCRPNWLVSKNGTLLELDFYIEELHIAIEVQGKQHFEFVGFFYKSNDDFQKRIEYDKEKKNLCDGKKIKLYEVCSEQDINILIEKIKREFFAEKEPYLSKLQGNAIDAINRKDKRMADALCIKCLKQYHQGKEKELHSKIKKYLGLL